MPRHGTGLAFAILFGIADQAKARSIVRNTHVSEHGITDVYPRFDRVRAFTLDGVRQHTEQGAVRVPADLTGTHTLDLVLGEGGGHD